MFQSVLLSPQEIYSNIQINECFFYSLHKQKKKKIICTLLTTVILVYLYVSRIRRPETDVIYISLCMYIWYTGGGELVDFSQ